MYVGKVEAPISLAETSTRSFVETLEFKKARRIESTLLEASRRAILQLLDHDFKCTWTRKSSREPIILDGTSLDDIVGCFAWSPLMMTLPSHSFCSGHAWHCSGKTDTTKETNLVMHRENILHNH